MASEKYPLLLDKTGKSRLKYPAKPVMMGLIQLTPRGSQTCFDSMDRIALVSSVSVTPARRALKLLEELGLVRVESGTRSAQRIIVEERIMQLGNVLSDEPLFLEDKKPKAAPRKGKVSDEEIPAHLLEPETLELIPAEAPSEPEESQEIQPIEGPYRTQKQARYAAATRLYLRHCDRMDAHTNNNGRALRRAPSDMTAKKIRAFENVLKIKEVTEELVADAIDGVFSSSYHLDNNHLGVSMICAERGGRLQKYAGYKNKTRHSGGYVSSTADLDAQWGRTPPTHRSSK